ncbi:MAG TPA: SpoIIE family protein phosphatase [Phycisphaerae bacterium]|nr:SpoIIE family protein phosphatase [Phycisphaerae bacterium]
MLRELIDISQQEDFALGLSRISGLRVCTFDTDGRLIVAGGPISGFARLTGHTTPLIPAGVELVPVPAHDPPAAVAFIPNGGSWYIAAPVYCDDQKAGWVAVGEFREDGQAPSQLPDVLGLWNMLPLLDRRGTSHSVITARWGARLLAEWCRREARVSAATQEAALIGDVAELLTGRLELDAILDRIVADTARVMRCEFCSLRLYDPKTNELRIKAVYGLSKRYIGKGAIVRYESSIDDEALSGRMVYVEDAAQDPRIQYPEEMRREGIKSFLTAGLIYRGEPIGVLRVYTNRRQRFRRTQRHLLRAVAHQAAMAIVHARMLQERLRSAETERQLALASDLQARMMCVPAPERSGIVTARVYQPSFGLGGDFCDIFTLCDGRLTAVVADVVGKGIPASLLSSMVRGALYATAQGCDDLGELLNRLNRQICGETLPSEFVTLLVIAVDVERRLLGYASAGHEPLLLMRQGVVREYGNGSMVLGIDATETYREHRVELQTGDMILLYTDGLVEAMNFSGELFGRERLFAALREYGGLALDQVLQSILWDLRRFVGLAEQSDDVTMIGLRLV